MSLSHCLLSRSRGREEKTVQIDNRKKECTENRKKANGKSRRALLHFKFFPPRWSSPNPPFFLDISPEMFKKQNLLGHFNVTCMLFCFPASYIPPQQPVPWRSYVGAAILGGGIGYTLAHLFKVKKVKVQYTVQLYTC